MLQGWYLVAKPGHSLSATHAVLIATSNLKLGEMI
jgi:hypothetical protein